MNFLQMYFCIYEVISIVCKKKSVTECWINKRSYCLKFSMKWFLKLRMISSSSALPQERSGYLFHLLTFHSKASIIPTYSSVITRLHRENCFIEPMHVRFHCIFWIGHKNSIDSVTFEFNATESSCTKTRWIFLGTRGIPLLLTRVHFLIMHTERQT